jgi:membrane protease subunit HflC
MNKGVKTGITSLFFIALLWAVSSLYVVPEGYSSLLLRLGKIEKAADGSAANFGPGLHYKLPMVNSVRIFDTRLQTLDIKSSRIVTEEKKDVIVDYYVKWRISNLAHYYKRTGGNTFNAESLLEKFLDTSIRAEFGKRTIADVVSGERDDIMDILQKTADLKAKDLGIEVVDVRIKGIDLPSTTSTAIYQRMRANMEKIANHHRADGRGQADAIRGAADKTAKVIIAEALSSGAKLRAVGAAKAEGIYSTAYKQAPDFFAFYRSLKAYEKAFSNKSDIMVLNQDSQFFNYFKQSTGLKGETKLKN